MFKVGPALTKAETGVLLVVEMFTTTEEEMQVSFECTPKKVFSLIGWAAVGTILLCALLVVFVLIDSSDKSGAGMVIYFALQLAASHFYLGFIPVLVVALGVLHDAKADKSPAFSIFKWLLAGLALYVVAFAVLVVVLSA